MKQLSKITLLAAFFACTSVSFAQISFGVKAGLNLANVLTNDDDADPKMIPTFQVGGVVEIGITEMLAVQTGVSLQGKGFKEEEELLGETFKFTASPMYITVPAHLLYKGGSFFVGAGPYVGYGIAGKLKAEAAGESESEDIEFGDSEADTFSALDFGVGVQAGGSFGSFRVGAGYDLGLSNLIPKDLRASEDITVKNGVINVFVAYMFGGGGE